MIVELYGRLFANYRLLHSFRDREIKIDGEELVVTDEGSLLGVLKAK